MLWVKSAIFYSYSDAVHSYANGNQVRKYVFSPNQKTKMSMDSIQTAHKINWTLYHNHDREIPKNSQPKNMRILQTHHLYRVFSVYLAPDRLLAARK
ncbi:hypothetical protein SAMN05421690_105410 [Nitrosomonas sp. Nm51]|nr:hypothetical protein SAMN05421690_105410 [Nitrosomonas sp. Nm51]